MLDEYDLISLTATGFSSSIHVMRRSTSPVAQRVRTLVGYGNSTARELSVLSGCAHSLLSGLFSARWNSLRLQSALRLARTCGVTVGWLLAGEGEPPSRETVFAAVEHARSAYKAKLLARQKAANEAHPSTTSCTSCTSRVA